MTKPINIPALRARLFTLLITWTELAKRAKISRTTLYRFAHFPDYKPSLRTLEKIAAAVREAQ